MPDFNREITLSLDAGLAPDVRVTNAAGAVRVRGEDRSDVLVVARARFSASSDGEADDLMRAIEENIDAQRGRVRVRSPRGLRGKGLSTWLAGLGIEQRVRVDYEIAAPRGCGAEVELLHGEIEVHDVDRPVRIELVNGSCKIENAGDNVSVAFVNGRGFIRRSAARVDVKMTNGRLRVEEPGGDVKFEIVHGDVDVIDAGGAVKGRCLSGRLALTGAVRDVVSLRSGHGSIILNVPEDSRFALDAWSRLGSVTSDLDVRHAAASQGRTARVSLQSEAGNIELRKLRQAEPVAV